MQSSRGTEPVGLMLRVMSEVPHYANEWTPTSLMLGSHFLKDIFKGWPEAGGRSRSGKWQSAGNEGKSVEVPER